MSTLRNKLARNFHKAYTFIVASLLSAFLFIETVFQFLPPETFGEIGSLGYALTMAFIAFLRALPQKSVEQRGAVND